MKHTRRVFPAALLPALLAVLLLSACGPSNNVRLLPPPPLDASVLPAPNAPRVSVVTFADKRTDQSALGVRRDNSAFVTSDDVAQWISRALADELARNGMQVTFALNVGQARSGNPDYLVTGQVDEAWLRETSAPICGSITCWPTARAACCASRSLPVRAAPACPRARRRKT